ncbi:hypothetical protein BCV69DRAFT_204815 [Microstroma glucosiphilum]|uniref:ZZ-type domain-containing protein n=1 Tax=Pseudomicrostroma glucosiphilum TaxID=1684307 RepID=A0A316U7F1_9BASI|nr:hypothetical protein BCV69DRAFT_204815 [Pseudomicrostroma glucosiphilum]PWN20283.1 hypothetical protein BCV69DRAFT_204815 [Pseudomicrostroma glucosiphilum]
MVLRLLEPLAQEGPSGLGANGLAEALFKAAAKLTASSRLSTTSDAVGEVGSSSSEGARNTVTLSQSSSDSHDVQCSFCCELIGQGARYLCANCPLDLASHGSTASSGTTTPSAASKEGRSIAGQEAHTRDLPAIWTPHEGFNLCSECEKHSLSIHNPDHFFLHIPSPEQVARSGNAGITPLRLNPYLTIDQRKGLLPPLYSDDGGWEEARLRIQAGAPAMSGSDTLPAEPSAPSAFPPVGNAAQSASTFIADNGTLPVPTPSPAFRLSRWMCPLPIDDIELTRLSLQERGEAAGNLTTTGSGQIPGAFPGTPQEEEQQAFSPAYLQHEEEYVRSLLHPNVLCDVCFEQIKGCWTRCANCVSSFDVVSTPEVTSVGITPPSVY